MRKYLSNYLNFIYIIFILLSIFSICRILFYIYNYSYFSDVKLFDFIHGVRFDLLSILWIYLPFSLLYLIPKFRLENRYKLILKILFIFLTAFCLFLNIVDVHYFKFTLRRSTLDVFKLMFTGNDMQELLPIFIKEYKFSILYFLGLIVLSSYLYSKIKFNKPTPLENTSKIKDYAIKICLFIFFSFFYVIGLRGGFQVVPLSSLDAGLKTPIKNISVVLNTPFTFIKSFEYVSLEEKKYFSEENLHTIYNTNRHYSDSTSFHKKNIVIIILEGFTAEFMSFYNDGESKPLAINLDSLAKEGMIFENFYANGRNSIESLPSILGSLPTYMETPYINSNYASNYFIGLPTLLSHEGYETSFFHGGQNGTMGFNIFSLSAGCQKYFGKNEYPDIKEHYDGTWGIYDEEFLDFWLQEIDKMKEPFFTSLFTLSSHHPYNLPKKYKDIFQEGTHPIYKMIQYTDYSIGKFMRSASKKSWYNNTIFLITADHTSVLQSEFYNTNIGKYKIPFILLDPSNPNLKNKINSTTCQQIDLMPTILDYLHYKKPFTSFGYSIFNENGKHFNLTYSNEIYQLIEGDWVFHFSNNKSVGLYNKQLDPLIKNNLLTTEVSIASEMETFLKANIQTYNSKLIHNTINKN